MLRLQKLPVVTADYLGKAREVSVEAGVGPGTAQDRASWTEPGPHRLRPPAAFRLPRAPAQQACPPRTLGKMKQDHARQVCRSGLCTKWTANISCGDDKNIFFKATGASLVAQWLGARVPSAGGLGSIPGREMTRSCVLHPRLGTAKQMTSNYLKECFK